MKGPWIIAGTFGLRLEDPADTHSLGFWRFLTGQELNSVIALDGLAFIRVCGSDESVLMLINVRVTLNSYLQMHHPILWCLHLRLS